MKSQQSQGAKFPQRTAAFIVRCCPKLQEEEKALVDYLAEPEKTDYVKITAEPLFLGKSGGVLCPKTETVLGVRFFLFRCSHSPSYFSGSGFFFFAVVCARRY